MVIDAPTDTDLLRRYVHDGSEMAFTEFVRRHVGLVYRVALRKSGGNRPLAEDVAQRVFTLLARKAAALTAHETLVGWLHQAAVFATSEILRAERRRIAREQEAFNMDLIDRENPSLSESLQWASIGPVIDEALSELGNRDREIILLRYFADLPHAQVGAQLALSENAARMRSDRALEKLRAILARRGVTSTTAALGMTLAAQVSASTVTIPAALASSISTAALASAAGMTGTVTQIGIVTFMTTAKSASWIVGSLAMLSLSFSGYTMIQRHSIERRWSVETYRGQQLRKEVLVLQAGLEKIHDDTRKRSQSYSVPPSTSAVSSTASSPPYDVEAEIARVKELIAARQKKLASNPDYQRRWSEAVVAGFNLAYQSYYRSTGIPAERISKFEEILMQKAWEANDLRAAAQALHLSDEDPAIKTEAAHQESAFAEELKSLLSPGEWTEFQQFDKTRTIRGLVDQVAANTYYTSTPLSKAQGYELTQLLEANDPHLIAAGPTWRQDGIDWEIVLNKGQSILSPGQFNVLQSVAARSRWIGEQIRIGSGWAKP